MQNIYDDDNSNQLHSSNLSLLIQCVKYARRNIWCDSAKNRCGHVGAASMLNSQRALSISHGSAQTHHTKRSTAFYIFLPLPGIPFSRSLCYTLHREHGECAHILHFLLGRYCTIKKRSSSQVYIYSRARCTTNKMHQYGRSKTTRQTESCARRRLRLVNFPLYMYIYLMLFHRRMQQTASYTHAYITQTWCIFSYSLVWFYLFLSLSRLRAIIKRRWEPRLPCTPHSSRRDVVNQSKVTRSSHVAANRVHACINFIAGSYLFCRANRVIICNSNCTVHIYIWLCAYGSRV
jgi:hypothetical protein